MQVNYLPVETLTNKHDPLIMIYGALKSSGLFVSKARESVSSQIKRSLIILKVRSKSANLIRCITKAVISESKWGDQYSYEIPSRFR